MPRSIELFAGGGGMALGMHAAGFENDQLVEVDARACAVLRLNAEHAPDVWKAGNVREMDVVRWTSLHGSDYADVDLVAGGPPCQPFSISGAHAGHNDSRNMFPAAIEAVRVLRPKIFLFENVPGLLRPGFIPYYSYIQNYLGNPDVVPHDSETWQSHHSRVLAALRSDRPYRVYRQVVNAADIGVPQVRNRAFLIGVRSDVQGADNWPGVQLTHDRDTLLKQLWITGEYWDRYGIKTRPDIAPRLQPRVRRLRLSGLQEGFGDELQPWKTVRDGLEGLPDPPFGAASPEFPDHIGIPDARTYRGHTGSPLDWPAKALKAGVHGVSGGEGMIRHHDGSVRYLSVREAARLQSFPDDYTFATRRGAAMRLIGNAVAVEVAKHMGDTLRKLTGL